MGATYKLKHKKADGTIEDVVLQGSIIDIADQYVRITDLDSGIYKLTYEGSKYIYYNGTSGTETVAYLFATPFILNVTKKQASKDAEAYWDWYTLCYTSAANGSPIITYGLSTVSSGTRNTKNFGLLLQSISGYVKDNLTYNTSGNIYALSAYQGYVLDQRLQALEQGGGGSGSGSAEPFIVTFTNDGNNNYTVDLTYDDIEEAFTNGKIVIGVSTNNSYIYQIFGLSDDDTIPFSRIVNWGENGAVVETLFVDTDDSVSYAQNTLATTALATATSKGLMSATDKKKVDWLDLDTSDGYIFTIGDDSVTSARIELNNNDNSVNATGEEVYLHSTFGSAYVTSEDDIYLQAKGDIKANGKKVATTDMAVHFIPSERITVVAGSGSENTESGSRERWKIADVDGITTPTEGMLISLQAPTTGHFWGVHLSIDGGEKSYPIYQNGASLIITFVENSSIILSFNAQKSCWDDVSFSTSGKVKQNLTSQNNNFALLFRQYALGSYPHIDAFNTSQTKFTDNIYANPSTGTIYANDFVVDGKSIVGSGGEADYDKIYVTQVENVEYDGDAIYWDGGLEFTDENDNFVKEKTMVLNLPFIAGDGIEFSPTDDAQRMVISATNTGGGSSSGGDADTFVVHFNYDSEGNLVADQSFDEVYSKIQDGKMPFAELWERNFSYYYGSRFEIGFRSIDPSAGTGVDGDDSFIGIHYISLNSDGYANYWMEGIVIPSGSQGSGAGQQSVTYAQLKKLRDDGKLVAGMQYRITDFVTTTSQPDTQSAGHPFNIIVTALSNTTLSENASADLPATNIANADGSLAQGSVQPYYYVFEDFNDATGPTEGYKAGDIFVAYDYLENNDGVVVPVLYKNEVEAYGEEGPDYQDKFYYEGTMEVDGVTYDKWRKICEDGDGPYWDGSTGSIWALTNVIVKDGQIGGGAVDPYFANANLPAWEIKYCLDNDKTRFAWADEGGIEAIRVYSADDVSDYIYVRTPDGDNENGIAWCYVIDSENLDFSDIGDWNNYADDDVIYTEAETVSVGDFLDMSGTEVEVLALKYGNGGKGVIYYMKDEWGNECPYDFKNIQFKRYAVTATAVQEKEFMIYEQGSQDIKYACGTSLDGCTVDSENSAYYYTFSYVLQTGDVQDLTIVGNKLRPDYEDNCVQNKMGIYIPSNYEGDIKLHLSNNVCVTTELWYIDNDDVLSYSYNTFGNNCNSNTFGNHCYHNILGIGCYHNTFGTYCVSNTFGNYCSSNTFGNGCNYNTFGNDCGFITFGNDCYHNTFGNSCSSNTFGTYCVSNTFGNSFSSNTFGNDCVSNTFGNNCNNNTFSTYCNYNTFGNECYSNTLFQYARYNIFENGVHYVALTSTTQGNYNNCLQNITVSQGVKGTSSSNRKTINATRNLDYKTTYVAKGSVTTEV